MVRQFVFATISILLGVFIALGTAEIALRFLPIDTGMKTVPVNAQNPVFHFVPNQQTTWSEGWDLRGSNAIRVNNAGYVSGQDYNADDKRPLLAIVGDSYVEALMVPQNETIVARLAKALAPTERVYSFAASGAPLSQYLAWAREARIRWRADALIVVVVGNDFDESLATYKTGPGFHHYAREADGSLTLTRYDYTPGRMRFIAERSYLVKYLLFNLHLLEMLRDPRQRLRAVFGMKSDEAFVGNTSAQADTQRIEGSRNAVRAFLKDMTAFAGWQPSQVLLALDGARYPERAGELESSYFGIMRRYLMEQAQAAGFLVIDLDPAFFARHQKDKALFGFPKDGHWNGLAHGVAADAILAHPFIKRFQSKAN